MNIILEKMGEFFDNRLDGYEEHMLTCIESAREFYHFDTPLTVEHEREALKEAGFTKIEILGKWGATCLIKSNK